MSNLEILETTTDASGTPNNPNASILIHAMQHLGYDNIVALCDIIDNSIDANATSIKINISSKNNNFKIVIIDNGCGMTKDTLDEALKFGSDCPHGDTSDLGKYGMGLSTAGLSLADKTTVLTLHKDAGVIYKSATDVKIIQKENAFVKYLGEASEQEKEFFNTNLKGAPSGTIVILEDCFGVKNKDVSKFFDRLIHEIARKYRMYMKSIKFSVNNKPVKASDPLMLSGVSKEYKAELYSDDEYEVSWINNTTGEKLTGKVRAKLVLLPDCSKAQARALGINMASQGFSVLRNNREIAFGFMPWETKHPSLNRVRGEILFDSSLDEAMGVNFTKNAIDMVDSINSELMRALKPQIYSLKKRALQESNANDATSEEEKNSHLEAEAEINKKSKVLITPPAKKEQRNSPKIKNTENTKENENENEIKDIENDRRLRIPKKYQGAKANVRFDSVHYGASGAIFEADQEGKTTIIRWNVDHPFYTRFIKENVSNKTLVTSVDFLIYSLAAAQIQAVGEDDDKAQMIENIISMMSTNMKVLLS